MTTGQRFERDLPLILDELAMSPYPDYIDSVLTTTARRRQRPTWTFPERWISMSTLTSRAATVPRTPLRVVVFLALLLVALAVGAALLIGSRSHVPQPFGPAKTGLVAYDSAGDIFTVNPVTGVSKAIITGPETDINPRWSRDGTHIAFERKAVGDSGPGLVYIARADGSDLVQLDTAAPVSGIDSYYFSPDGSQLLISYQGGLDAGIGYPSVLVAATDGSGFRDIGMRMPAAYAAWRPKDGSEILFMGIDDARAKGCCAIQAVNTRNGDIRTILGVEDGRFRGHAQWSPDGSLISFGEWGEGDPDNGGLTVQTHVIAADGTGERVLASPPGTDWQAPESWSNDGTRLLVIRGDGPDHMGARPAIIPVDGHDTGIEIDWPSTMMSPTEPSAWEWAPDDSTILGTPVDEDGANLEQVLLDPIAGTSRTLPWHSDSNGSAPSFQRLAP